MKSVGIKFFFIFVLLLSFGLGAQTPYDVVKKNYKPEKKLVHDFGKILDERERATLEQKLVAYNDSTSVQIVIVTFKNLEGYPIELLGNEIGENWGIGQKDLHNGIVIVFSKDDRKVTLRGGYGIQSKMPPTVEKLIIDREMIPSFRNENYYQGFDRAVDAIQLQLAGQYEGKPKADELDGFAVLFLIIIIIFFMIIISSNNGPGSGGRRGGGWGNVIITNTGSSSWPGGGFGSGGGGFGGFGGGSFGGGGATGGW